MTQVQNWQAKRAKLLEKEQKQEQEQERTTKKVIWPH
jgi:hypothetical protein